MEIASVVRFYEFFLTQAICNQIIQQNKFCLHKYWFAKRRDYVKSWETDLVLW